MVRLFSRHGAAAAVLSTALGQIGLAADDRLDTATLHGVVERNSAIHVAVIGHGAGVHTQRFETFGEWFYLDGAVEKTVISVQM